MLLSFRDVDGGVRLDVHLEVASDEELASHDCGIGD